MDFATKLKCYRHMLNLTQTAIADALGVDRSTYSYYESGKSLPTSEGIRMLSRIFGVSPATLLNEKPIESKRIPTTKAVFSDSGPEIMFGKKDNRDIDMTFPELTEDEKEMITLYRTMKAAEAKSTVFGDKKGDIIRRFLAKHYK